MPTPNQAVIDQADLSQRHGVTYGALPFSLQAGARRYIEDGTAPGKFLRAVLSNDFAAASVRADHLNLPLLPSIARWLYNGVPEGAWGSAATVDAWIDKGGLRGRRGLNEPPHLWRMRG